MIEYMKRTVKDRKLKRIAKFKAGCWINTVNPTKKELRELEKNFKIEKQNLLSGLDENEIPRVEFDGDKTYVILKAISKGSIVTILILVTKKFILTLSKEKLGFIEKMKDRDIEIITTQKLKSLLTLLSLINRGFEEKTLQIVKKVRREKNLLTDLPEKEVRELLNHENELNELISSYYQMNTVYKRLVKKMEFFEEDGKDIEDLIIETEEGFNLCKSSLKTITNFRNNLMVIMSNRLNRIITLLTILTVFISIPAAISGIYGMNLMLPLQGNPNAFYYIMGITVLIWTFSLIYFKKKKII